jgi:hypothetical protein
MSDMSVSRLTVSGPLRELEDFIRDAAPSSRRANAPVPPDALSFKRLRPLRRREEPQDVYGTPSEEPDQVTRSAIRRCGTRTEVEYQFVTIWDAPYILIETISEDYPRLDFVLATVGGSDGTAGSWYVRNGQSSLYAMGDKRNERIYWEVCRKHGGEPGDVDEDTSIQIQLDLDERLLDAVTKHWTPARRRRARGR